MLLIHTGLHKTGTTTFQNQLWENKESLADIGILYPEACLHGQQHSLLPGSLIANHPFLPKDRIINTDLLIEKLASEINKNKPELTILSSEVFSECIRSNPVGCLEIIDKLPGKTEEKHILLSIRPPIEYALSSTKHCIRANLKPALTNPLGVFRQQLNAVERNINFWANTSYRTTFKHLELCSQNIAYNFLEIPEIAILNPYNTNSRNSQLKILFEQHQKVKNSDTASSWEYILFTIWNLARIGETKSLDSLKSLVAANNPPKAIRKLSKQPCEVLDKFIVISSAKYIDKLPSAQRRDKAKEILESLFPDKLNVDSILSYLDLAQADIPSDN